MYINGVFGMSCLSMCYHFRMSQLIPIKGFHCIPSRANSGHQTGLSRGDHLGSDPSSSAQPEMADCSQTVLHKTAVMIRVYS